MLSIESDQVSAPIKYELASNGLTFPHIYGPLNLDAVVGVRELLPNVDGEFELADGPENPWDDLSNSDSAVRL